MLDIQIQAPGMDEGRDIYSLVRDSAALDLNSEYLYILLTAHYANTCAIAKSENKIVGFVSAYILPEQSNVLFIWQIAVDQNYRKQGIALNMLKYIISSPACSNIKYIQTTISPSNAASISLFKSLAANKNTNISEQDFMSPEMFNQAHEEEKLFIIGPLLSKTDQGK